MAEPLRHPGPASGPRLQMARSRVSRRRIELAAGVPLDQAIPAALQGDGSAWIVLGGARADIRFVLPDRATDGLHAAWYSPVQTLAAATIHRAGIVWGLREGRGFGHCHGLWGSAMGHLLLDQSVLCAPCIAEALIFTDARFEASPDAETAFTLFKPVQMSEPDRTEAALLRLAPHVELASGLSDAMGRLGWDRARLAGLGSLDTARLADGRLLDSHATEFLIRPGAIDATGRGVGLDIVGIGGAHLQGCLAPLGNRICVTAELVLTRP